MSATATPPLPTLSGSTMLEVFTHPSLGSSGTDDYSRYADLGSNFIPALFSLVLFSSNPKLTRLEIAERRTSLLTEDLLERWVTLYGLRTHLRCIPTQRHDILHNPKEMGLLFSAYAGGVIAQLGVDACHRWIAQLIAHEDPSLSQTDIPVKLEQLPSQLFVPDPSSPISSSASSGSIRGRNYVSILNEIAQKKRMVLDYESQSIGPDHSLQWTMKVKVNGVVQGQATATDKKAAKENAALAVLQNMGL